MSMSVERITVPESDPFLLADVKEHFRVDSNYENAGITTMARAAALEVEAFAQVALLTQTIRVTFDPAPLSSWLTLPIGPLKEGADVTLTIDGVAFESFELVTGNRPSLRLSTDLIESMIDALVVVEYEAGFGAEASSIPADLTHAIHDHALALYDGRAGGDPKFLMMSPHMARIASRYRRVAI
jgi:uncharacterized phiE125 gp8 family phage protein